MVIQEVKGLPLNGRSFDQLLTLKVGTVNNSSKISSTAAGSSFSVVQSILTYRKEARWNP